MTVEGSLRALVPAALLVMACAAEGAEPIGSASPQSIEARAVIDEPLLDALARGERPLLAVAFDAPSGRDELGRREIARIRTELILLAGDFELVHAPRSVAAFGGRASLEGLLRLLEDPRVRRVDADAGGGGGLLEALPLAGFDATHATGLRGEGAILAVIDTGFGATHVDLQDALLDEACFCPGCCPDGGDTQLGPGSAADDHGHGSFVAGVITADGIDAPAGAIVDAEIVAVKVIDSSRRFEAAMQVVEGLDWVFLEAPSVQVVNLSLGTDQLFPSSCDEAAAWTMALRDAVSNLVGRGVTVVAAAMNDASRDSIAAPACLSEVLAVGATFDNPPLLGQIAPFSNSNALVDIVAPGAIITSVDLGGTQRSDTGTSYSAPLVASCAALLHLDDPSRTPADIHALLAASGPPVEDRRNGLSFPTLDCAAVLFTDVDRDGVEDGDDNCPREPNPGQEDSDGDGTGDACDRCGADVDTDGDGVCDDADVCPGIADPDQRDLDGDGLGDRCDACPDDALNDADSDGHCANLDNCPMDPNADQIDADLDGVGDVCDPATGNGCGCSVPTDRAPIAPAGASLVVLALLFRRRQLG